jgi:hypothetical protein
MLHASTRDFGPCVDEQFVIVGGSAIEVEARSGERCCGGGGW